MTADGKVRCGWVGDDPLYLDYHDREWGVPLRDERRLFELLILEGAQAGLSWITILRKRENYRAAFDGFDPSAIARYGPDKAASLKADAGIVRNRAKIEATIGNAQSWLRIMEEHTHGFSGFIWDFVDGTPVQNRWKRLSDIPI